RIRLSAPRPARAAYTVRAYAEVIADRAALDEAFGRLPTHPGRERLQDWNRLADAGDFETLAGAVMELHYDPAYARSSKKDGRRIMAEIALETVDAGSLTVAADQIAGRLTAEFGRL